MVGKRCAKIFFIFDQKVCLAVPNCNQAHSNWKQKAVTQRYDSFLLEVLLDCRSPFLTNPVLFVARASFFIIFVNCFPFGFFSPLHLKDILLILTPVPRKSLPVLTKPSPSLSWVSPPWVVFFALLFVATLTSCFYLCLLHSSVFSQEVPISPAKL